MVSEEELNLAKLPSDVIRKIILIEQESINYLRLIAPEWNTLALEHFTHRKNLPDIHRLEIIIDSRGKDILEFHLSGRYLDYFGIRKRSAGENENHNDCGRCLRAVHRRGKFKPGVTFKLSNVVRRLAGRSSQNTENLSKLLAKVVRRCARIDKLIITMDINQCQDEFKIIKRAMAGASITELHLGGLVNFNKKSASILCDILCAHPVKRLFVTARNTTFEAGLFDTLKHLHMDTTHLVETGKFTMFSKVKIDEYLAVLLDEGVRERMRDAHRSRLVEVYFTAILAIAPEWNSLALEHFTHRKNLPPIQRLHLTIFDGHPARGPYGKVWVQLSERYLDYFGIKKRSFSDPNETDNDRLIDFEILGKFKPGVFLTLTNFVRRLAGRYPEPTENLSIFLAKLRSRCSRIVELRASMDIIKHKDEFNAIKRALDGATVTELRLERLVNLNKKSAVMIRELLRAFLVESLYISSNNRTLEADIFDTLEHLYKETMGLVQTGDFKMKATVGIDEYLAIWDKKEEDRERIRNSHHSRKVRATFLAFISAGQILEAKCESCDIH